MQHYTRRAGNCTEKNDGSAQNGIIVNHNIYYVNILSISKAGEEHRLLASFP